MTRGMTILALGGTLLIAAALFMALVREPARQVAAIDALRTTQIAEGTDLYAAQCVTCHGAAGEGLAAFPPLSGDAVRLMDEDTLFRTIERGRYNTAMAAFGVDEGGILTQMEIASLVTLVQDGPWDVVAARVEALGRTPPELVVAEVPEALLAQVAALPGGDMLAPGLTTYAETCSACHGANGEGTVLAPPLNSAELRARLTDADVTRIITQGVPGTLMSAWERSLTAQQLDGLTALIRQWDVIEAAGVALPKVEAAPIDSSPQAIATGQQLFSLVCSQCHGSQGFGTALAPALNSQTFLGQTPDEAIRQIIAGGVTGTAMPAWSGYLTEADIAAIVAYLRSLEASAPAIAAP